MTRSGHVPSGPAGRYFPSTTGMSGLGEGQPVRERSDSRTWDRRDRGSNIVEFAMVAVLLFILLFGIIGFGVMFSFKQTLTQAANEAARTAAVHQGTNAQKEAAAEQSVQDLEAWGRDCSHPGMSSCTTGIFVHDCGSTTDTSALPDCITVRLTYDYGNHPIVPSLPFIGALLPDTVESSATAQLTFPG